MQNASTARRILAAFFILFLSLLLAPYALGSFAEYDDVPEDAWYAPVAEQARDSGLMRSVSKIRPLFAPTAQATRAQAIVVLCRLDRATQGGGDAAAAHTSTNSEVYHTPELDHPSSFADVPQDAWYAYAVDWGIATGVTGRGQQFKAHDTITRAEFAVWLYNLFDASESSNEVNQPEPDVLERFGDSAAVADGNQREAIAWCVRTGVLQGLDEAGGLMLNPNSQMARAELAAFACRALEILANDNG